MRARARLATVIILHEAKREISLSNEYDIIRIREPSNSHAY